MKPHDNFYAVRVTAGLLAFVSQGCALSGTEPGRRSHAGQSGVAILVSLSGLLVAASGTNDER